MIKMVTSTTKEASASFFNVDDLPSSVFEVARLVSHVEVVEIDYMAWLTWRVVAKGRREAEQKHSIDQTNIVAV